MGHHYVPQEYLRGFASNDDRTMVWMFDKARARWSEAAISKVAQQRGYFPPDTEDQLNVLVERPGNDALRRLRCGEMLDAGSSEALNTYIGVMLMRVPTKRRRALGVVPSAIESVVVETLQELRNLRTEENQARLAEVVSEVESYADRCETSAAEHFAAEVNDTWPSDVVLDCLRSMSWHLVRFPVASPIVTSDNPAFFFSAFGIGSRESELTFPVSPSVALVGSRTGRPRTLSAIEGTTPIAKEINRRMTVGAERFVFSSGPFPWVVKLARRKPTELSRIKW